MATNRDDKLSGSSLHLFAQMSGGCTTIIKHLNVFCYYIEQYGLKPWGRKGREYLNDGIDLLVKSGAYDSLTQCNKCREHFLMTLNTDTMNLFLKSRKEKIEDGEWVLCNKCGGQIEG